jgi:RNAse (barnase) inhibitor barstar
VGGNKTLYISFHILSFATMTYFHLTLDLSAVETLGQFHEVLQATFGFPDFYGKNIHALIDCLSSLRDVDDGMSEFILRNTKDVLILNVKNLSNTNRLIANNFIVAIEQVNNREVARGLTPSIILSCFSN